MNDELFEELLASLREGAEILKGQAEPSRTFTVEVPDIKELRTRYKLSQSQFAMLLGISPATLRNWEQGRRQPEGPARVLLQVAAKHPEVLLDNIAHNKQITKDKSAKKPGISAKTNAKR